MSESVEEMTFRVTINFIGHDCATMETCCPWIHGQQAKKFYANAAEPPSPGS